MLLISLALLLCLPGAAPAAAEPELPSATVRLVNASRAPDRIIERAAGAAARVFRRAGIQIDWVRCAAEARQLPAGDPCLESAGTFYVGVIDKAPDFLSGTGLGFAFVDSGFSNHAAVYYPRIEALARSWPLSASLYETLALALAHELGHLLLGTGAHSPTGLMRATCGPGELHAFAQRRLTFSAGEAAALRARLARLGKANRPVRDVLSQQSVAAAGSSSGEAGAAANCVH